MDIGLELRQARERRGLSLQQIANITKISPRVLQAIEASDQAALPPRVFTRSFVKTYAAHVGLDPDETTRRYLEQFEPPPSIEPIDGTPEAPAAPTQKAITVLPAGKVLRGRFGTATVLLLAGTAAVTLAVKNSRDARAYEQRQPAVIVSAAGIGGGAAPQPAAVGTSGTSPAPEDGIHLAIAPTAPCWVSAKAGDQLVFAALLNPGDRRTVDTTSEVTLRVGDPAAFAWSINGKPARISGQPGQAVTVHVTKDNYRRLQEH